MIGALGIALESVVLLSRACPCHAGLQPYKYWTSSDDPVPQTVQEYDTQMRRHTRRLAGIRCVRKGM